MATVKFSVPDDVRDAFNEAFKGRNKSAIIAELMREAVDRFRRRRRSHEAIERILERRRDRQPRSDDEIRSARRTRTPMIAVLDASVVVKWFLGDSRDEPHAAEAIAVLRGVDDGAVRMVQPPHFLAETAAVSGPPAAGDRRGGPTAPPVHRMGGGRVAVESTPPRSSFPYGCGTTCSTRSYHATAMHHDDAVLVTSDEAYYDKAHGEGRIVRLRDFGPKGGRWRSE